MTSLPITLFTAQQVRELDRIAIQDRRIPGISLMKRAGRVTFETLLEIYGPNPVVTVYCGAGNNGGDGYIVAALAAAAKLKVKVVQVADASRLKGDARLAYELAVAEGVEMAPYAGSMQPKDGIIVDAMLGTGLSGDVRGDFAAAIAAINEASLPVVAVDIPSGLCADTGKVFGDAVNAEVTVTFIGLKRGLFTGRGPVFSGEVFFDDLGVPADIYPQVPSNVRISQWSHLKASIAARPADAHKGLYGHVMVIGGDLGFGGAVSMAAEAALRTGAGLVSVATRPEHIAGINARCPEVMAVGVSSGQALEPLLDRPTVLVIGPGMGRSPWSEQILQKALSANLPMVLDADALNILSEGRIGKNADLSRSVLTPHPGEAARLLCCSSGEIQDNRFAAVRKLADLFSATALLKGAGTLITSIDSDIALCPHGNPGMAVGGMGDVLSGVIGAMLAQGLSPFAAAETAASLHALAGDRIAGEFGRVGMAATDLIGEFRPLLNDMEAGFGSGE